MRENCFVKVAEELIAKRERKMWRHARWKKYHWLLKPLGSEFGRRPVAEISPAELLHLKSKHHER